MAKFQYKMIAQKIQAEIRTGALQPGMPVPSSRDLSNIYKVSHITAVHALKYLAGQGILLHKQGKNYVVSRKLENTQNNYRFLTLLFRHISSEGAEFYGNRIIAGITREAAFASIGSHLSANAAKTIFLHQHDFSSTLDEALMLPKQNIGFIADFYIPDEILEEISLQTNLPIVVIGRVCKLPNVHSVVLDPLPVYRDLLGTLKRMGYNAFICCENKDNRHEILQQHCFFQELQEKENAKEIVEYNQVPEIQQRSLLHTAIDAFQGKRIAIFAASDSIARRVIQQLNELNLKVPEQIGVVGFYGTRLATEKSPKLSCLSVNPTDLGKIAADLLILGDTRYRVHEIPMSFVFGETIFWLPHNARKE